MTTEEQALLEEEQALLLLVQTALRARRPARYDPPDLLGRLAELREQAVEATAKDLPTVFQEMGLVRAMMEHPRAQAFPDPDSPYFAHLSVREGQTVRDYCLGRTTFVDLGLGVRVVDWRYAPVSRLFYAYREGDPYEERFPGRLAEGVVLARRVVVVQGGELVRVSTPSFSLVRGEGDTWVSSRGDAAASLGGGAGTAARPGFLGVGEGSPRRAPRAEVTALLDREQFEALQVAADEPLLVVGSAGSGKTTVALHRLARIAFENPRRYAPSRLQVVVPELGLAKLATRLLEPLGLSRVAVRTLDTWSRGAFQSLFGVPPPRLTDETPPLVARLKRHPALYHALRRRPHVAGTAPPSWSRLRAEMGELFSDRAFLAAVVAASQGELPSTAVEETLRHTRLQLASPLSLALRGIDPERVVALDGEAVDARTPEALAGSLDAEDLPILLFLRSWRSGMSARAVAHLVVDEAEDVSLFELFVLGLQVGKHRSLTLAGDEDQQTTSAFGGWDAMLRALGAEHAPTCRLETTYRCPEPVARLAQAVLGPLAKGHPPTSGRPGVPVGRFDFPSEAHAHLFVAGAVRELLEREPAASVAVVSRGPEVARNLHRLLEDLPEARLVLDGDFSFRPGVDLTDVESVKGLEFDYVIVPDASASTYPADDESRRRLHVAVTRTSHQLWITTVGAPSPLLATA
ncbi:MAG TPA: ATP-binding domain-containing protein [Anaeromyxobacteraceae bacterium]|nr:ATP-binding domain-containing protein [Anaeromyxobacteraceae bacterium]